MIKYSGEPTILLEHQKKVFPEWVEPIGIDQKGNYHEALLKVRGRANGLGKTLLNPKIVVYSTPKIIQAPNPDGSKRTVFGKKDKTKFLEVVVREQKRIYDPSEYDGEAFFANIEGKIDNAKLALQLIEYLDVSKEISRHYTDDFESVEMAFLKLVNQLEKWTQLEKEKRKEYEMINSKLEDLCKNDPLITIK